MEDLAEGRMVLSAEHHRKHMHPESWHGKDSTAAGSSNRKGTRRAEGGLAC